MIGLIETTAPDVFVHSLCMGDRSTVKMGRCQKLTDLG